MSMASTFAFGFGFNLNVDNNKIVEFVKRHKESFCKKLSEFDFFDELCSTKDEDDLDDLLYEYDCDIYGDHGNGAVISTIMRRETGISFGFFNGDYKKAIIFPERMPWLLTPKERDLTEESLSEIISGYMDELGIEKFPEHIKVEYID